MSKPSLTIISEKWCDFNPNASLGMNYNTIYKTALISDLFSHIQYLHQDELYFQSRLHINDILLNLDLYNKNFGTKYIHTDIYAIAFLGNHDLNADDRSLSVINGKKFFIWPDTVWPWIYSALNRTTISAKFHIALDMEPSQQIVDYLYPNKMYFMGTSQDTDLFYEENNKKYDVSFSGEVYQSRKPYIEKLKSLSDKYNIYTNTGQRYTPVSMEEYAETVRKSKIIVNHSLSPTGECQVKSRAIEAFASNVLLLEYKNNISEKIIGNNNYVEYSSPDEMTSMIDLYIHNETKRKEIAKRGNNLFIEKYSPVKWWSTIMDIINNE